MIKIRIGGWAGQGTVLAGQILATTLAMEQGFDVIQKRSYSAAVRSGTSYSDIIADDEIIDELVIDTPDILIVLYQKTLDEWKDIAKSCDKLVVDSTRINDIPERTGDTYRIPAGDIAEKLGTSKVANIVLLGALCFIVEEIELESLENTIRNTMPSKYIDLNLKAVCQGYDHMKKTFNDDADMRCVSDERR